MSRSDAMQKKVEATLKTWTLWRNLALLAAGILIAITLTHGWNGIAQGLKQNSEQALAEAGVDTQRIHVQLEGRQAQLKGFADTQAESDKAAQALSTLEGLSGVDNRIQVRRGLSLSTQSGAASNPTASATSSSSAASLQTAPVITANSPSALSAAPIQNASPSSNALPPLNTGSNATQAGALTGTPVATTSAAVSNPVATPTTKAPVETQTQTLLLDKPADVAQIKAEWRDNVLTLKGALSSARERADLMDAARQAFPNEPIEDQIVVQAGLDRADWLNTFAKHLYNLKQGPAGKPVSMSSSAVGLAAKPEQVGSFIVRAPKVPGQTDPSQAKAPTYRGDKVTAKAPTPSKTVSRTVIPEQTSPVRRGHSRDKQAKPGAAQTLAPAVTAQAPAKTQSQTRPAADGSSASLRVRGQRGQMTVMGQLSSMAELNALNSALQLVWPPGTTLNLVQVDNRLPNAPWLEGLNASWLLLNQVEWLDLSASDKGVTLSGWIINDDISQRTATTLAQRVQPVPVRNELRSIQGQSASVSMAHMLNSRLAHEVLFVPGRAELAWSAQSAIDQIANMIRHRPEVRLTINVHEAGSGNTRQDLYLSQKRAQVIKDQLVTRGVARDRLMALGHGNQYPVRHNQGPNNPNVVRRVEFSPL